MEGITRLGGSLRPFAYQRLHVLLGEVACIPGPLGPCAGIKGKEREYNTALRSETLGLKIGQHGYSVAEAGHRRKALSQYDQTRQAKILFRKEAICEVVTNPSPL